MSKVEMNGQVYWKNIKGNLVPDEMVKEIDKERDCLVRNFVEQAIEKQKEVRAFKTQVFDDIGAFIQLSAEKYDVQLGGRKGNVTLVSYDGEYKLMIAVQDRLTLDERIQAAKQLIDECLHEWSADARPELRSVINDAFQVDKEGNLNTARILSLRRVEIQDERWTKAMQAISDSIQIVDSKDYVRFYKRDENGNYQQISLDMARV
ncbi:DUF3164 family protein [Pasteurella multocida]|uniref:DUF3164 family protein n=1 Tax=Pasteurella multocida TaxID=747 RepID=UPI0009998C92|nr:DUF3164 family protein [Pasteurella multocida]ARA88728.1 sulfate transporter [Pasteurella multocida subsp. septica]ARA90181.1 sulfate transporter [Pasteurella multocida subsp. septica]MCL7778957.1 DUF3164 family protein [Pasteurella multocida]OPC89965.1 sulfate transporter [Pasteurella multocida subsp. septica]OPC97579.1 sulfate transporter [Pasteurella multocida subsp. septica]